MAAITWRNVDGPDPAKALVPMLAAQNSFNSSADTLGNMITARMGENTKQENLGLEAQRNAFLDSLSGVRTPEELAAMQASGQLEQQLANLDPRVRAQVRDAATARMASLRQGLTQEQAFEESQTNLSFKAPRDNFLTRIASATDPTDLAGIAEEIRNNPNMPNRAALVQEVNQRTDALRQAKRSETSQELTDLRIKAEIAGLTDTQQGKAALDAVATRAQQHQQSITQTATEQAKQFDPTLPRTPGGLLDLAKIRDDPAMSSLYSQEAKRTGLDYQTDTVAVAEAEKALIEGGFTPRQVLEAITAGKGAFNTDPTSKLTGLDKIRFDQEQEAIAAAEEEAKRVNSMFVTNTNLEDRRGDLRTSLKTAGLDSERIRIVQDEVTQMLKKNPDAPINMNTVIEAAASRQDWDIGFNTPLFFRNRFQQTLRDMMSTGAYKNQVSQYEKWKNGSSLRKEDSTRNALTNTLNPDRRRQQPN